jgi:hypothetical protein
VSKAGSSKHLILDRLQLGFPLVLGLLVVVVAAVALGMPENLLYPLAFASALLSTVIIFAVRRSKGVASRDIRPNRRERVLFISYEIAMQAALKDLFVKYSIDYESLAGPMDPERLLPQIQKYFDLIILDAALPYNRLVDIKASLSDRYPEQPLAVVEKYSRDRGVGIDLGIRILEAPKPDTLSATIEAMLRDVTA